MLLEALVIGIGGSIIATNLVWLITNLVKRVNDRRSGYAGDWVTEILDQDSNPIKVDHLSIKQSGEAVAGIIRRQEPEAEKHREWKFSGRIQSRDFFAVFWSLDPSLISYGCWYVHQHSDHRFEGYYLRLSPSGSDVTAIPLRIFREKVMPRPTIAKATFQVITDGLLKISKIRR